MDPYFKNNETEIFSILRKVVEMETPTYDKVAVDRLGSYFIELFSSLGAEIKTYDVTDRGNHILATIGSGPKTILLLHHMDTVFPIGTLPDMPYRQDETKTYGPGVLDMKSGVIISYFALRYLLSIGELNTTIKVLITSDEEVGSQSSESLIVELAKMADLALVLESGLANGALKTWRKGVGDYVLEVFGKASHAGGFHQEGVNAIEEIAHQIITIQQMTNYDLGTTLNVGTIQGGSVPNVVPEYAKVEIDFRVLRVEEAERVDQELHSLKPILRGTRLLVSGGLNRPPMPYDDLMNATFQKASQIGQSIGQRLVAGGSGGGSDGNLIAPLGIAVLDGIGAYGEGLHSDREYIYTKSISERAELIAALIKNW